MSKRKFRSVIATSWLMFIVVLTMFKSSIINPGVSCAILFKTNTPAPLQIISGAKSVTKIVSVRVPGRPVQKSLIAYPIVTEPFPAIEGSKV